MLQLAEKLDAGDLKDIFQAAELVAKGKIVAFPFNGIFGLFGRIDKEEVAERIMTVKNRSSEKTLVTVIMPELLASHTNLKMFPYDINQVRNLITSVHALGVIIPASKKVPRHLIKQDENSGLDTLMTIWTEYRPLREFVQRLKVLGIKGLVATSANKSGEPAHVDPDELWEDFKSDLDAVVTADFKNLPKFRRKSTSIIDLTYRYVETGKIVPKLFRLGNCSKEEISQALLDNGFSELFVNGTIKIVRSRGSSPYRK